MKNKLRNLWRELTTSRLMCMRVDSFYRSAIGCIIGRDDTLSNIPVRLRTADTRSGRFVSRVCASKRFAVSVMMFYLYSPTRPPATFHGFKAGARLYTINAYGLLSMSPFSLIVCYSTGRRRMPNALAMVW